jgi:hypothetical protein
MSTENYAKYISEQVYKEKVRGFKDIRINEGLELTSEDYINMLHMYIEDLESHFKAEDLQQIQELSKGTLGRYINKASTQKGQHDYAAGKAMGGEDHDDAETHMDKSDKRKAGINRAVSKLTK